MNNGLRVLVVEDEKSWQELYAEILSDEGFHVSKASTLEEARNILDYCFFHAAIVDLRLSKTDRNNRDGMEVLRHIMELSEGTGAVVMSGYADIKMFDDFRKYGISSVAEKVEGDKGNMDIPALLQKVREAAANAQRLSARKIWEGSPFNFMNGLLARDVQLAMGGGQMSELRQFLGSLCYPFTPWLQAKVKPVSIEFGKPKQCVGYQTPCWSRALGEAVVVRFGKISSYDKVLKSEAGYIEKLLMSGTKREKLREYTSLHFKGEVYRLDGVNFAEHFKQPALQKIADFH